MSTPKSRRNHSRYALMGQLPGTFRSEDNLIHEVVPIDISTIGLGLLMDPAPNPGAKIRWETPNDSSIIFRLVWTNLAEAATSFGELSHMRRCGLLAEDQNKDLIAICREYGGVQIIE